MTQRAVALIDGEHYAPVVKAALEELPYDFVAAHVVGGTEKLRDDNDYGVQLADDLDAALDEHRPELVFDLSDEPILGPKERFRLASRVLAAGLPYVGADFRFDPPVLEPFALPSIGIIGTGKRVGKTAITAHAAQLYAKDRRVVVVAMGRGGPPEPEVASVSPDVDALLELSRSGRHAASDYLETAALAGVETVGCRRCGGGLAGSVAVSNVREGAKLALELDPDLVIFDGSGAAIPPIQTGRRILVVNSAMDPDVATGYLNEYRHLVSDLVILTMAERGTGWEELHGRALALAPAAIPVVLRPKPVADVSGRTVAFFSTAPSSAHDGFRAHLSEAYGADVVHVSGALADRATLRKELEQVQADVFLVELKAAAIDVVAEAASERGVDVVLAGSDVIPVDGQDFDAELLRLAQEASGVGSAEPPGAEVPAPPAPEREQ
ncbi:MAG: 2,3-diphosphoglycerate synthetase [Actinomycetota bacterium]|nr:2,3-diphosphoglycerate synthetase [Actinomycetota bacterium]